jgi:hypothetical protein
MYSTNGGLSLKTVAATSFFGCSTIGQYCLKRREIYRFRRKSQRNNSVPSVLLSMKHAELEIPGGTLTLHNLSCFV